VWATIARVTKEHSDIGIAMNPSPTELGILLCAGAGQVSVFTNPAFTGRAFRLLARRATAVPYESGQYVPGQYLALLKPHGIESADTHRRLAVDAPVLARVRDSRTGKFAVIAPGAGHSYKEWPRERFDAVAAYLKEKYAIASVYVGVTETLEELKALVSLATVVIANDSGVIQIAEAFDTPSITIAGATDWREHHVDRPLHRVIRTEGGVAMRSFVSDHEAADEARLRAQMASITVKQVTAALDELIATLGS
jgi:ADP-heptose:LPS heptosyltransferase